MKGSAPAWLIVAGLLLAGCTVAAGGSQRTIAVIKLGVDLPLSPAREGSR